MEKHDAGRHQEDRQGDRHQAEAESRRAGTEQQRTDRPRAVIAGGSGFIGAYLSRRLKEHGFDIAIVSRQPGHIRWDDREGIVRALDGADMLINLAGRSVNCRYNAKNREQILRSRTETTQLLGEAVLACGNPPPLWINSSTATIYRHAEDRPMTEAGGDIGTGFSVEVAQAWERALFAFALPRTRQVALRIAIALGDGGVMTPYIHLVRAGLGGPQGPGTQMFSWIHIEDLFRIVLFLRGTETLSGAVNAAAPNPVPNRELMRLMRRSLGAPIGLPAPAWMLEIGARLIGTETELILKSRWVVPERLEQAGFQFRYSTLDDALQHLLRP